MKRIRVMWIAGEASGDVLATELAVELRKSILQATTESSPFSQPLFTPLEPYFFGAGGEKMRSNNIDILVDFTKNSAIGPYDALKNIKFYKHAFNRLLDAAFELTPDLIICVDFSGFNLRFASELRNKIKRHKREFFKFNPIIVQYISPQVWASRPWRAKKIAKNFDLLLSIFPFEKDWYKQYVPELRVEFVGHPLLDRYERKANLDTQDKVKIVLLPGSRVSELKNHIPVMKEATGLIRKNFPNAEFSMVLPSEGLKNLAKELLNEETAIRLNAGNLQDELSGATLAIASTGTVTMECAFFGVPAVAVYKTSPLTYLIGKKLVKVRFLAMPNIIANKEIYPELIQDAFTPERVAEAALKILNDKKLIKNIKSELDEVIKMLGEPGSATRSAKIITELLMSKMPVAWHM